MTRNMMLIIYGVLALLAIGLGLFVANLFGSSTTSTPAPNSNSPASAPATTSAPAPTAPTLAPTAAATQAPQATNLPTHTATAAVDETATIVAADMATATANATANAVPTSDTTATTAVTTATAQSTSTAAYTEYTVKPGDSLKAIAQRYGVTVQQILNINDIPNPDSLTVGTVIKIPTS